jgi:YD repeat-containing protein
MKTVLFITIAALAAGCARPAYVIKSDAEAAYMRGQIKQLTETVYDAVGDSLAVNTCTVVDYNRVGNITRTDVFKGADSIHVSREEYSYDPSGKRMESAVRHDPLRQTYNTVLYRYDEQGRLVQEIDRTYGWHYDYAYDRHGYLRSRVDTAHKESPLKTVYRYDRLGRLRVEKNVKGGGPKKRYTWHGNGETIAEIRSKTEIDRYDERGNLVSMTAIVTEENNKKWWAKRTFPFTMTAEHEYDPRGNWIRRVQLYKGAAQTVAVREIDYWGE